jgi:hypothetical protein
MSYSLAAGNEKHTHNFGGDNFLKSGILGRQTEVEDFLIWLQNKGTDSWQFFWY